MRACIDIGGTKVSVSLNAGGDDRALLATRTEATARSGTSDVLARQVERMVDEACVQLGVPPQSVQSAGVCAPGPFVMAHGAIALASPNLCGALVAASGGDVPNDWRTVPLEAPLRQRFKQLRIENDAVAALEAERRWGALQGLDHCAYVTWSTGVGGGLCVGGRVLRGKHGNAGHVGHIFVSDDDHARCGCGNVGDLEALVGGHAVARRLGVPMPEVMTAAQAGDAQACQEVEAMCRVMGRALYDLIALLDLQRIALGGSVFFHHQALLLPRLIAQVRGRLAPVTDGCELVPAGLGGRVGDYGALALLD
jgi:glucokinase